MQVGRARRLAQALKATGETLCVRKARAIAECFAVRRALKCVGCSERYFVRGAPCLARMCPRCEKARATKYRSRLDRLVRGCRGLRHLTLTLKWQPELGVAGQLSRLFESFRELRRRAVWRTAKVAAGVRACEFKRSPTGDGWHVHLHVLVNSAWLDHDELAAAWHTITGDSFVVDIRRKSERNAVSEITKYVVKPGEIDDVAGADLVELVHAIHGRRMVEFFGDWRCRSTDEQAIDEEIRAEQLEQWERLTQRQECPTCGGRLEEVPLPDWGFRDLAPDLESEEWAEAQWARVLEGG